jgi:hypothetical protein
MAWWSDRVVAPVRRAWFAVAAARARVRKGGKHLCILELSVAQQLSRVLVFLN